MSSNKRKRFSKTSAKTFKFRPNTKRNMFKKANASKLKEQQNVYALQPKADHQGSKFPSTDFRCMDPYIVEKALSNNNYLVQKLGTNKTQVLHCIRLRLFTPKQPIPDVQTTSQEWKPDPDVIIKYDDLYARAWKSEYELPIFDQQRPT